MRAVHWRFDDAPRPGAAPGWRVLGPGLAGGWPGWMAGVAAAAILAGSLAHGLQARLALQALQAEAAAAAAAVAARGIGSAPAPAAPSGGTNGRRDAAPAAPALPWPEVFQTLEASVPPQVALLSLDIQSGGGPWRLQAQSATPEALLRHLAALSQALGPGTITRVQHEPPAADGQPGAAAVHRMSVEARPGAASPAVARGGPSFADAHPGPVQ